MQELPELLRTHFSDQLDPNTAAIMGHSMGGHGALVLALRNPDVYKSVSAFSPICNPVNVPWGIKAFTGYLGEQQLVCAAPCGCIIRSEVYLRGCQVLNR